MKRILILSLTGGLLTTAARAQTLRITSGSVTTALKASADELTFADNGTQLTAAGKTFAVADIDSIYTDDTTVDDNTVLVAYNGTTAHVTVAGNIAPLLTVTVNGANVAIVQDSSVADELNYTLSGNSDNGSFYMKGSYKATLTLNGLTLTSADSAAVNIQDGKRIALVLTDGTTNRLADGASGSQKGCLMIKGHTEVAGGGSLTLAGNAKHAFWGGEYLELKKSAGTLTVTKAAKDGFNVEQYYKQKGGTVNISGTGDDGIQVSASDDATDELNGQALISGGSLTVNVSAAAAKGLKCDSTLTVTGGTIDITTTGDGEYDSDDNDVSGSAALKTDGDALISGGTITLKSTGAGGKGLSADGIVSISDGTVNVTTTGTQYVYGSLDTSPKGIKADGNLYISGGTVNVTATGGEGSEGIESKDSLFVTGGTIIVNTYDDALNATNHIDISGGKIYALATGNDGIDSNGTLSISGGLVIASGTLAPESGLDCDENTFAITGGTVIGLGGDTSTPTTPATTQPVIILKGQQLSKGNYISLTESGSSTPIFTFAVPQAYNQATLLLSSPNLSTGNTYTITSGATVTGGTEWQGYSTDATASGGTALATLTLSSTVTSQGNATGPGGNGGGPGGNPGGGNQGGGPGGQRP